MSYSGGRLAPLFDRSGVDRLCRDIVEHGARRMTELTRANTPIGHQPFSHDYIPGALRESIHEKLLVVYIRRGVTVYESGCETNLDYAPYVEDGTGIYHEPDPHTEWVIRPRRPGGWLSWIDQETGNRIFAREVHQKGSHGQHMFAIGAHLAEFEFNLYAERLAAAWARRQERQWQAQRPVHYGRRL